MWRDRYTGRKASDDRGRDWNDTAASQPTSRIDSLHQKLGRGSKNSPLQVAEGVWPRGHLDFGLQASRSERINFCSFEPSSLWETNTGLMMRNLNLRSSNCTLMWSRIKELHLSARRPIKFSISLILLKIKTIYADVKLSNISPLPHSVKEICEASLMISFASSCNSPGFNLFSPRGLNSSKATNWISTHLYTVVLSFCLLQPEGHLVNRAETNCIRRSSISPY